ncbi:Hypothetical_protein [Hexamita inflata]|uniref:Hypothetical_protein n=1 Tax=Hexamita inflata TaxID=28002 RepID=A0AA86PJK5_9EUKA|nr:Hypothetical protein HINF_LOCUS27966 [Hexamita inflata]
MNGFFTKLVNKLHKKEKQIGERIQHRRVHRQHQQCKENDIFQDMTIADVIRMMQLNQKTPKAVKRSQNINTNEEPKQSEEPKNSVMASNQVYYVVQNSSDNSDFTDQESTTVDFPQLRMSNPSQQKYSSQPYLYILEEEYDEDEEE